MDRQQNTLTQRFNGKIWPPAKLVNALNQIECTDPAIPPRRSAYDFPWFDEANRRETMDYLLAKQFAEAQHLYHQIAHYKQQVVKLVTKDMADRVLALAAGEFGYTRPRYYHPDDQPVPDKASFKTLNGSPIWCYQRIEDCERLIPRRQWRHGRCWNAPGFVPRRTGWLRGTQTGFCLPSLAVGLWRSMNGHCPTGTTPAITEIHRRRSILSFAWDSRLGRKEADNLLEKGSQ